MVGDPTAIGVDPAEGTLCPHHWLIESPAGETSGAVCKLCGASRHFSNYSRSQITSHTKKNRLDPDRKA